MNKWIVVAFTWGAVASTQGLASAAGSETTEIRVRYEPRELASPAGALRLLRRIGDAALESCGASAFSLAEIKAVTLQSQCWKDAVEDAVRRIDNPLLTAQARAAQR
jgi:UrcA family protein